MENKVGTAEGRKTNKFRTSEWPTDPAPVAGEPIVEYFTCSDLYARRWLDGLITSLLKPDGKRYFGAGVRVYYLVEQTEGVHLALAPVLELTGKTILPANIDKIPLALKCYQMRNRGWTDAMMRRFLGAPDATEPESLYSAERVQQVEASEAFQEWWVRLKARRARAEAEARVRAEAEAEEERIRAAAKAREERIREDSRRAEYWKHLEEVWPRLAEKEKLRAAFPGFFFSTELRRKGTTANIRIRLAFGPSTSAEVSSKDVCALIQEGNETGNAKPLIDWLLKHEEVGNSRFRAALGFLAAGDPDGWRARVNGHRSASGA